MRLNIRLLSTLIGVLVITSFLGCSGPDGVRITEGQQQRATTAPLVPRDAPQVVHVDLFERIATIRNGSALGSEFLISTNYAGKEIAVLKARPSQNLTLLTADILEGTPEINHIVKPASPARQMELVKLYSIASEQN
jgi:hypothetical protein